jgi:hypothetical protein
MSTALPVAAAVGPCIPVPQQADHCTGEAATGGVYQAQGAASKSVYQAVNCFQNPVAALSLCGGLYGVGHAM